MQVHLISNTVISCDNNAREEAVVEETQAEGRSYQDTLKQLRNTEKSQTKASKDARKAAKTVKKKTDKEHDTIQALRKATDTHDRAVSSLHNAQSDLQAKEQNAQRLSQEVDRLRIHADDLFREMQAHDTARKQRLTEGGPSGPIL